MFPKHWKLSRILVHAFCEMLTNQKLILENQEKIMSKLDDLNSAIAANTTKVTQVDTNLDAFIAANSGGATDGDLASAIVAVNASNAVLDTVNAKLAPPAPPSGS